MTMTTNQKVASGNRIVVTFDGNQFGMIQSLRMSDDYSPEPASGIGDIHVQEYVPTLARHTLTVSRMVLESDTMRELGIFPEDGDSVLQGLVFSIEVYAKDDGTLLRTYTGVSYASGDLEINKHAIVMSSGTFYALDVTGTGA